MLLLGLLLRYIEGCRGTIGCYSGLGSLVFYVIFGAWADLPGLKYDLVRELPMVFGIGLALHKGKLADKAVPPLRFRWEMVTWVLGWFGFS